MTLSIITINYNNRDGLQRTIDSVVDQSFTDYEWIIIDGGSNDGSGRDSKNRSSRGKNDRGSNGSGRDRSNRGNSNDRSSRGGRGNRDSNRGRRQILKAIAEHIRLNGSSNMEAATIWMQQQYGGSSNEKNKNRLYYGTKRAR